MRFVAAALLIACVASFITLLPRSASADGGFGLTITPEELEWGDKVRIEGYDWFDGDLTISVRFVERRQPDHFYVPPIAPGDFSFERVLRFEGIDGLPDEPTPGWVEVTVQVGSGVVRRSHVITVDGRRPDDAAFIGGRIDYGELPLEGLYVVWVPLNDSGAYEFAWTNRGEAYRTTYLTPGDWFVGLFDLEGHAHAAGPGVFAVTGYSEEIGADVTLAGRLVHVAPGETVDGVDFTLAPGPAPASEATRVPQPPADPTPTSLALTVAAERERAKQTSNGWLAPALLGAGGGLLAASVGTLHLAGRRRRR